MTKKLLHSPVTALLIANILWGIGTPILKIGLQNVALPTFAFLKFGGGALLFLPLAIRYWQRIPSKEFVALAASSFIGISLANLFLFAGLVRAPSINASVIYLLQPILLYVLSVEILKQKLEKKLLAGIILSCVGAVFIIGRPVLAGGEGLSGNAYFLLFVIFDVIGTLMVKPILRDVNPYQITFIKLSFAAVPFTFFGLSGIANELSGSLVGLLALGYGIMFNTAIAYHLFYYGLRWIGASKVGLYSYADPIAAVLVAYLLLNERPDILFLVGSLLIFTGLYLAEGRLLYHFYMRLHHHHR
jgi:drug/metabolite transporter (DMT)-like permease